MHKFIVLVIISLINSCHWTLFNFIAFIVKLIFQFSVVSENWKVRLIHIVVFGHLQWIILHLRLYSKWQHLNKSYFSPYILPNGGVIEIVLYLNGVLHKTIFNFRNKRRAVWTSLLYVNMSLIWVCLKWISYKVSEFWQCPKIPMPTLHIIMIM